MLNITKEPQENWYNIVIMTIIVLKYSVIIWFIGHSASTNSKFILEIKGWKTMNLRALEQLLLYNIQ